MFTKSPARILALTIAGLFPLFSAVYGASAQTPAESCSDKQKTYDEFFWKLEIPIIRPNPREEVEKDINKSAAGNHQDCERFCTTSKCFFHTLTHKHVDDDGTHNINYGTGRQLKKAAEAAGSYLQTLPVDNNANAAWEHIKWLCVCSDSASDGAAEEAGDGAVCFGDASLKVSSGDPLIK